MSDRNLKREDQGLEDAESHFKEACEIFMREAKRLRQEQKAIDSMSKKLEHNVCVRRRRTLPNAVEIDILGIFEGYSSLQIWPPQKIFRGEII